MCQQMPDPVVSEAELRRYLRHASVLLGIVEPPSPPVDQRVLMLRRARHWLRAALAGVDQLLRIADAIPETIDDPLTPGVAVATIPHEP